MSPSPVSRKRTVTLRVDPDRPDPSVIREAARCLSAGGLVAFPTETVYGLGADARSSRAVAAVFEAKGRPPDNPLIVHVASPDQFNALVADLPAGAPALVEAFWPGPLSLVLAASGVIAPEVSGGLGTVAVRMPAHPVALELIRWAGVPLAAPSANRSGRPSPTRAEDVLADLDGRIDYVLDAGPCPVGVESTVIDLTVSPPVVLRPGGVTLEDLHRVLGPVRLAADLPEDAPTRSPGTRHRHYRPRARVILVLPGSCGPGSPVAAGAIARTSRREAKTGRTVGVVCSTETAGLLAAEGLTARAWGSRQQPAEIAAALFAALRDLDDSGVDTIVAEGLRPEGLGLAVNDRLSRAATATVLAGDAGAAQAECEGRGDGAAKAEREGRGDGAEGDAVLLICTGNTCRSPMAAVILADELSRTGAGGRITVRSAGTAATPGCPASPEAVSVMAAGGLDLSTHLSRAVTEDMVSNARLILTMTQAHRDFVLRRFPEAADRVHTLKDFGGRREPGEDEDIADPIGHGRAAYEAAAREIRRAAEGAAARLRGGLRRLSPLVRDEETPEGGSR